MCVCVFVCKHVYVSCVYGALVSWYCVWMSEDNFVNLVLFSQLYVDSRDQTQALVVKVFTGQAIMLTLIKLLSKLIAYSTVFFPLACLWSLVTE